MSGATNAPGTACGHAGFCEPGSAECLAKDAPKGESPVMRAVRQVAGEVDRELADRARKLLGERYEHVIEKHASDVPMHPTNRDLNRLTEVGGRPLFFDDGGKARVLPADLVSKLVEDAKHQLDRVAGIAALMHLGRRDLVDQAVARWHHDNPGLSRLLDLTEPSDPPSKDHD